MRLIVLCLAWLLGLLLGAHFSPMPAILLLSLIPLPLLFTRRFRRLGVALSLNLLALTSGIVYFGLARPAEHETRLSYYNGRELTLRALVCADPDVRDGHTILRLSAVTLSEKGVSREVAGLALAYVPRYPAYSYGDALEVTGELAAPENSADFDYAGYLEQQDVYSVLFYPWITRLARGGGNPVLRKIYSLRHRLGDALARSLPEPQAAIAQAVLLGLRAEIPEDVSNAFLQSGTTHLLAISGLNLTLLAGLLVSLLVWLLGRRHYYYVGLAGGAVWFYTALCGAGPPVVRAAVMASVFLLAELAGRQKSGGSSLLLAAALMAAANPKVLWDTSFQLSALAMGGLVYIYPLLHEPFEGLAGRLPERVARECGRPVLDSLAVSFAAAIAVWPALAAYFGQVAPASPAATLLGAPALPFIIVLSLAAATLGLWNPVLGQLAGALVWLSTSYLVLVAEVFARFPVFRTSHLSVALIVGYYALLAGLLFWLTRQKRRRLTAGWAVA